MIISTALSLNPAGMIANCRYACIVNREEEQTVRIGIDLGGTKTEVIALGDAGEQLFAIACPRRVMIIGKR